MTHHRLERRDGIEAAAQDDGRSEQHAEGKVCVSPRVEERRGDHGRFSRLQWQHGAQRHERTDAARLRPGHSARCPGRPGGENDRATRPSRPRVRLVARGNERVDRAVGRRTVVSGDETGHVLRGLMHDTRELLVEDDCHRVLPCDHLAQLRRAEARVALERSRPQLGERRGRQHEAAMVAAQHGDGRALLYADVGVEEPVRQRVAAPMQRVERELAMFVDHGEPVGMPLRVRGEAARHREPPPAQCPTRACQAVRPHRIEQSSSTKHPHGSAEVLERRRALTECGAGRPAHRRFLPPRRPARRRLRCWHRPNDPSFPRIDPAFPRMMSQSRRLGHKRTRIGWSGGEVDPAAVQQRSAERRDRSSDSTLSSGFGRWSLRGSVAPAATLRTAHPTTSVTNLARRTAMHGRW